MVRSSSTTAAAARRSSARAAAGGGGAGGGGGRGLFFGGRPSTAGSALWQQVATPIRNLVESLLNQLFRGQRTRLLPPPSSSNANTSAAAAAASTASSTGGKRSGGGSSSSSSSSSSGGGGGSSSSGSGRAGAGAGGGGSEESGPRVVTVAGLSNLGNTCFLNSVLQSLATLSPFVDSLAWATPPPPRPTATNTSTNTSISPLVLDVLQKLQPQFHPPLPTAAESRRAHHTASSNTLPSQQASTSTSSNSSSSGGHTSSPPSPSSPFIFRPSRRTHRPTALLRAFHARCSQLEVYEQQDAEELLQLLVNLISDELSTTTSSSPSGSNPNKPPLPKPPAPLGSSSTKPLSGLRTQALLPLRPPPPAVPTAAPTKTAPTTSNAPLPPPPPPPAHAPASPPIPTPTPTETPSPFRNPLAGWWASTLQCCGCGHRRPVQNSAFIDVPLPLPEAQAILRGQGRNPVRYASLTAPAPSSSSSSSSDACHLMDCLREFASEELVQEVECWSCRHRFQLAAAARAARRLESAIRNADEANLDGAMDPVLDNFRAELAAVRAREEALRALNPDDPRAAALFSVAAAAAASGDGGRGLTAEEAGALGGGVEGGLRMPARKRLVFSRLPSVLCFHLGRRVFSPALGRMTKARQRVVFPLLMDVGGYAAYGGRMSDDVAEGATATAAAAPPPPSLLLPPTTAANPAPRDQPSAAPPAPSAPSPRFLFLLQAVVVHHGSADGGHYTTYRRLSPVLPSHAAALLKAGEGQGLLAPEINTWVHASDDQVVPAPVEEVLGCEAYLLFYQSLDSLLLLPHAPPTGAPAAVDTGLLG